MTQDTFFNDGGPLIQSHSPSLRIEQEERAAGGLRKQRVPTVMVPFVGTTVCEHHPNYRNRRSCHGLLVYPAPLSGVQGPNMSEQSQSSMNKIEKS